MIMQVFNDFEKYSLSPEIQSNTAGGKYWRNIQEQLSEHRGANLVSMWSTGPALYIDENGISQQADFQNFGIELSDGASFSFIIPSNRFKKITDSVSRFFS